MSETAISHGDRNHVVLRQGSQGKLGTAGIGVMQVAPTREGVMKTRLQIVLPGRETVREVFDVGVPRDIEGLGTVLVDEASEPDAYGARSIRITLVDAQPDGQEDAHGAGVEA